ncbi:hypothetical protein Btru_054396 [Bulinus truncatus]|nr:hypothetical protein Btru_054396 [Bulinus truncatus]
MQYVKEVTKSSVTVSQKPFSITIYHPGLNVLNIDRDGNVCVVQLMKMLAMIGGYTHFFIFDDNNESYFGLKELHKDYNLFVRTTEIEATQHLHNPNISKRMFKIKFTMGHIGQSTVLFHMDFFTSDSNERLMTQKNNFILVDKVSRRAAPIPGWFREKFAGQCLYDEGYKFSKFLRPNETFSYTTNVMWYNTDYYEHMNYAEYVKFILNGLHAALDKTILDTNLKDNHLQDNECVSKTSALKDFSKDAVNNGIKKIQACYFNECTAGDSVVAHVWQSTGEANIIRGSIEKGDKVLCQVYLEYFGPKCKL